MTIEQQLTIGDLFGWWQGVEAIAIRLLHEATPFDLQNETYLAGAIADAEIPGVVPTEYAAFLNLLRDKKVHSFLHVGAENGALATLTAAYLARVPGFRTVDAIDSEPEFIFYERVRKWLPLNYNGGTNTFQIGGTYSGVLLSSLDGKRLLADYHNKGQQATVLGLQHLADSNPLRHSLCGPMGIWLHIKAIEKQATFIEVCHHPDKNACGLGIRVR